MRNPCSVCSKPMARTHRALRCSTCYLHSHIKCGDVTPVAYREIKAMSNYHWVCRFCKISSAMPFSDVEDVDFLQVFQDGEKSINNQDGGCQNRNIANDSNSASWYKENIRSHYKFNLTIARLNVNALVNKVDEVKSILDECSFDILFLAETKLNSTIGNLLLDHPNYRIIRKDRTRNGGGIMAYVRSNITVVRRRKFEPANIESLSLDVKGNNGVYFMICACYRSPSKCKPAVFLTSLATTLELMYNSRREIVVIGGLNFDLFSDHNDIKKFKELCDQFQLTNSIETPTRVTESTATLLDLILSSHPDHYAKCGSLHLGISDHDLIYTVRKQRLPKPPPKQIYYQSMKNFDAELFIRDLKNVPWESAYIFENVDDIWSHWKGLYNEVLDLHAPIY